MTRHPPSQTRPPRILIVEDDLVIALMIEEFVREFGYAVSSVAGTVAMARLQIAHRNFDAVSESLMKSRQKFSRAQSCLDSAPSEGSGMKAAETQKPKLIDIFVPEWPSIR